MILKQPWDTGAAVRFHDFFLRLVEALANADQRLQWNPRSQFAPRGHLLLALGRQNSRQNGIDIPHQWVYKGRATRIPGPPGGGAFGGLEQGSLIGYRG